MRQPPAGVKSDIEGILIPLMILDIRKVSGKWSANCYVEDADDASDYEVYCVLRDPASARVYKEWIDPALIPRTQLRGLLDTYRKSWDDLKARDSAFTSFSGRIEITSRGED